MEEREWPKNARPHGVRILVKKVFTTLERLQKCSIIRVEPCLG